MALDLLSVLDMARFCVFFLVSGYVLLSSLPFNYQY